MKLWRGIGCQGTVVLLLGTFVLFNVAGKSFDENHMFNLLHYVMKKNVYRSIIKSRTELNIYDRLQILRFRKWERFFGNSCTSAILYDPTNEISDELHPNFSHQESAAWDKAMEQTGVLEPHERLDVFHLHGNFYSVIQCTT